MVTTEPRDGLRERSKARRREAILRSAYRLFAERGFDATTIADIAEAAEVSPRTVTLYFPSKLELALARSEALAERLRTALYDRKPGWLTLDALEYWLRGEIARRSDLDDLSERMFNLNPQLRAVSHGRLAEVVQEGARMFAAESGNAPAAFGPRMVAVTAAAIISELLHHPENADIDAAMEFLKAGVATLSSTGATTAPSASTAPDKA
ncbi:TetR/AcrR family transcriptional regulator [Streptomyces hokutonensis]|uniref:TetR/AcrR family transcriptional regulator n=1 Tax=Streptomyces hokutonensis TaxID=1306990 RepID=UPI0037F1C64A